MAERKNDYEMVFHCHINWAFNLAEMLNYDDALDYLSKAYKISVEKLSKREEMSTLNNMAYLYLKATSICRQTNISSATIIMQRDKGYNLSAGICAQRGHFGDRYGQS